MGIPLQTMGPSHQRILVAQGSRTLSSLIRAALEPLGWEILLASDGPSALRLAKEAPPALLISDMVLPGLDGYALAHAIRQLGGEPVKVMLLVAQHQKPDPERLAYVGIDDVVGTPFERAVLLERVKGLLEWESPTPTGDEALDFSGPSWAGEPAAGADWTWPSPGAASATAPTSRHPRPVATPEAVSEPVMRPQEVEVGPEALERAVAALLPEALEGKLQALMPLWLEEKIAAAIRDEVAASLPALVDAAVAEALDARLTEQVRAALTDYEPQLEALMAEKGEMIAHTAEAQAMTIAEAQVEKAIAEEKSAWERAVIASFEQQVQAGLTKELQAHAEQIVWKVVPSLAEDLIKEEIKRLMEP